MGAFDEELRGSPVEATSPDGTVTLRLCADGDVVVRLADGSLARHDEEPLGRQVSATVRLLIAARARAYEQALRMVTGPVAGNPW